MTAQHCEFLLFSKVLISFSTAALNVTANILQLSPFALETPLVDRSKVSVPVLARWRSGSDARPRGHARTHHRGPAVDARLELSNFDNKLNVVVNNGLLLLSNSSSLAFKVPDGLSLLLDEFRLRRRAGLCWSWCSSWLEGWAGCF